MQTRLVARSGGKPTLMSSGGAAMVAKPRGGSSGLRLCVPCFYDSDAPRCSPSEHEPLSIRLRSALPAFRSRPPRSKDHALVRTDHLRPQSQASRANVMNVAERSRGDFPNPSFMRTHAQSRAEIESPRARGPYSRMGIFCYDKAARRCAPVEAEAFPNRLRPTSITEWGTDSVRQFSKSLHHPSADLATDGAPTPRRAV